MASLVSYAGSQGMGSPSRIECRKTAP
jgi:hypothetical protein